MAEKVFATVPQERDRLAVAPADFFHDGQTVIVRGVVDAKARSTGREMKAPFVHVFTVVDGKIKRMTNHHETAVWLETLGA